MKYAGVLSLSIATTLLSWLPAQARESHGLALRATVESDVAYAEAGQARRWTAEELGQPLALAAGDFDRDGIADLVVGSALPEGGVLTLYRVNAESVYPTRRGPRKEPPSPFVSPALVFRLPEVPRFLDTGDFDGDGRLDIVSSAGAGHDLWVSPGDGGGGFSPAERIAPDAELEALIATVSPREDARSEKVAELAMRLNSDAVPDLVVLERGRNVPSIEMSVLSATFTVNTTDDFDDGACDAAHCTLREAVRAANSSPGLDLIEFAIPGGGPRRIFRTGWDLDVTDPVVIDGTTQPGYAGAPLIEIYGATGGPNNRGMTLASDMSTVRGLVINLFDAFGIVITGNDNVVEGNYIGTDPSGTVNQGNAREGVLVLGSGNVVGAAAPAGRNIVSGNARGVRLTGAGAVGNHVRGNYIGTDVSGSVRLSNGLAGVMIDGGASGNVIGGAAAGEGNLISTNGSDVLIFDSATTANLVQGNLIGTDATGTVGFDSLSTGVNIVQAPGNEIGGNTIGRRNVISSHSSAVRISGATATANLVYGNFLGTDVSGTVALANRVGVLVEAPGNTIGGALPGAGNLISGGGTSGVFLAGAEASGNEVLGNYVGTDVSGTAALGNDIGIFIRDAPDNRIGGASAGQGNLISGNRQGVLIILGGSRGNRVEGNLIGTDAAGTAVLGNSGEGVALTSGANGNTIGGTSPGAGNVVGGNGEGVVVTALGTTLNRVEGNSIGTDTTGTLDLGNEGHGVSLSAAASHNTIGGTGAGAGNVVAFNRDGIFLRFDTGIGNAILGNSIFANSELGIDRDPDGVTPNDAGVGDNFPVLSTATVVDGGVVVRGTLDSTPEAVFRVELFANEACDPTGFGEAQTFLGAHTVTTDAGGHASFTAVLPAEISPGRLVTSTAIDPNGTTSEIGQCVPALVNEPPAAAGQSVETPEDSDLALTLTGSDPDGDALTFSIVTAPAKGVVTDPSGTSCSAGACSVSLTYVPNTDFHGSDTFTFQVDDGRFSSDPATVSITVTPVNDPPVADPQSIVTAEDTPLAVTLTGSDVDGEAIFFSVFSPPAHGTLAGSAPALLYTPDPDFNGVDSFTYTAGDGELTSAPAPVTITVTPVNDPPTAFAGPDQTVVATSPLGGAVTLDGTASADPEGAPLSFLWSGPFGTATGETPTVQVPLGVHTVTLTVTDSGGATASDSLVVAMQGFLLTVTPAAQSVVPGDPATWAVEVTPVAGFGSAVSLSTAGLPPSASAVLAPDSVLPGRTAFLTVTTAASTPLGTSVLTVTGSSASLTQAATIDLTVTTAPQDADFAVVATPARQFVAQGAAILTTDFRVLSVNGWTDPVIPSLAGLPPGASASFSTDPVIPTGVSPLTWTISPTTPVGTYPLTITGTAAGSSRSATVQVTVVAVPGQEGNTPESTEPWAVDLGNGVTASFTAVTGAGETSVTTSTTGPPPPSGFRLAGVYYEITTTASFVAPVTVCVNYADSPNEANFRLLHREGNNWIDATLSGYPDTVADVVCGEVSSFSEFAVTELEPLFSGGAQSSAVDRFLQPVSVVLHPSGQVLRITESNVVLPAGTTRFDVSYTFGPGALPETLEVTYDRVQVLAPGALSGGAGGVVIRGLAPIAGRAVLAGRMAGSTANARDRDRLVFFVSP